MGDYVHATNPQGVPARILEKLMLESLASGDSLALLIVNVDQLERVQGTLGHDATVALTQGFRDRVGEVLRDRDLLYQVGDRKFWLVLRGPKNEGHAVLAANKLRRLGKEPFWVGKYSLKLDASVGIALFPQHADSAAELIRRAELALLSAREDDVPIRVYAPESTQRIANLWEIERELERALEDSEFELFYQAKIDVQTLRPVGAEALLRWRHPTRGVLAPNSFIAIAEHSRKLEGITWFVIDAAQRQRADWPQRFGSLPVSVNIPPCVLDGGELPLHLRESMPIWDCRPGDLILEVTEDSIVRNPVASFAALGQLRQAGLQVAIDDFGTGYSSMSYFKDMPADELKIDRTFVRNIHQDVGNQHIVRAMIHLAHTFNFRVVGEGVETVDEFDTLATLGCDVVQGFLYGRPQPHDEFVHWLRTYVPPVRADGIATPLPVRGLTPMQAAGG